VSLVKLFNERGPGRQTATRGSLAKLMVGLGCHIQQPYFWLSQVMDALMMI
jgi:hypothetical protein